MSQQIAMFPQEPEPADVRALKRCSFVYTPKKRAREYSSLACNPYRGCGHGCLYCFAPSATFKTREQFSRPTTRGPKFAGNVQRDAAKYQKAGRHDRVLLAFTCDPYQPLDVEEGVTRETIEDLHAFGLEVQVLTKGGTRALRDLDLFTARDAFATTMTFLDDARSLEWEPGAALPADRIAAIERFHRAGVPTWISLEPVLDPASGLAIIRETSPIVDVFKVGKLNHHPLADSIDWAGWANSAIPLLRSLGYHEIGADHVSVKGEKGFYVKHDLRPFLKV